MHNNGSGKEEKRLLQSLIWQESFASTEEITSFEACPPERLPLPELFQALWGYSKCCKKATNTASGYRKDIKRAFSNTIKGAF